MAKRIAAISLGGTISMTEAAGGGVVPTLSGEALLTRFGLDDPIVVQFGRWFWEMLQGNLGYSFHRNEPVADILRSRAGPTLLLMGTSMLVAILVAVPLGLLAAVRRNGVFDFHRQVPPPQIVPRTLVQGVAERVDYRGEVVVPLQRAEAERAVRALLDAGVETIAVCLLWSFRNPSHEQLLGEVIRELAPGMHHSLSCEVHPVIREYERMVTTVFNSYAGPRVTQYTTRLAERLLNDLGDVIPEREAEALLFAGRWPLELDDSDFEQAIGPAKYSAHLNYLYGVLVEEALQLHVEEELHKESRSRAWGTCRPCPATTRPAIHRISKSRVRGPQRSRRSRPAERSMRCTSRSRLSGVPAYSNLTAAFRKSG